MHDFVVDAHADGVGVTRNKFEVGVAAKTDDLAFGDRVDFKAGHADFDVLANCLERHCGNFASFAHANDLVVSF